MVISQGYLTRNLEQILKILRELFLISYAISKDIVTFHRDVKNKILLAIVKFLAISGAVGFLLCLYIFMLPFILIFLVLHTFLKCIHGNLYGGYLPGLDGTFEMKPSKTVFNIILILSYRNDPSKLIEKLKKGAFQLHQSNYKFGSQIKSIFGYKYYLKNQVEFPDVVEIRKYNENEFMTRNNLLDFLEENCRTLTKDQMWNVVFFNQPILWSDKTNVLDENKQLAVAITIRHCLADLPSIMGGIKKHFQLTDVKPNIQKQHNNSQKVDLNLDNVRVLRNPLTNRTDGSALRINGKTNWHIATFTENHAEYLPRIEAIKQELNCSFVELMCSVLSASICDYARKRTVKLKNFTIESVARPTGEDVYAMVNTPYNYDELENRFGGILFNVPLYKSEEGSIKNRILEVHRRTELLPYSVDAFLPYSFFQNLSTYLPAVITRFYCYMFAHNITFGISNVVGLPKCTCDENTVDDILFFAPEFLTLGFLCFVHSYDGRLQIAAISRRGFVHNRNELLEILNNAIQYIDQAEKEILAAHIP